MSLQGQVGTGRSTGYTDLERKRWTGWTWLAVAAIVLVLFAVLGGVAWYKISKVYLRDYYRDGYAIGSQWRMDGVKGDCEAAARKRYPTYAPRWHAFVVGCGEGRDGVPEGNWNLRPHLVTTD